MQRFETLDRIAREVRHEFETGSISTEYIMRIGYEQSGGRISDMLYFWASDMSNGKIKNFPVDWCDRACAVLLDRIGDGQTMMGSYILPPKPLYGTIYEYHAVHGNALSDHVFDVPSSLGTMSLTRVIVDVTGDQFEGGQPVYLGPLQTPYSLENHRQK